MNFSADFPSSRPLDGAWLVCKEGESEAREVQVPGALNTIEGFDEGVYIYTRRFEAPAPKKNQRAWLTFGSVEYLCSVSLNGKPLGSHEGGHGEFTLEATAALQSGENELCVRVVYPLSGVVDGVDGKSLICPRAGGGIHQHVLLSFTGALRLGFMQAHGDIPSGAIALRAEIDGGAGTLVFEAEGGWHGSQRTRFSAGCDVNAKGETTLSLPVGEPQLWSCESPYLYNVEVRLYTPDGALSDTRRVKTAFRDFHVDESGHFVLNGKRIYLKCAHGGTHVPFSPETDERALELRRHFVTVMKAAGFNCIRYLQGTSEPSMLDLCDELGLMVYQEHPSSWLPNGAAAVNAAEARSNEAEIARRYYNDLESVLRRDINHPCIVIWGLLNETVSCLRHKAAAAALPRVRAIDATRLVILSSGSWGGSLDSGSVCNPGSVVWSCLWGAEGRGYKTELLFDGDGRRHGESERQPFVAGGYCIGAGDAHFYPVAQVNSRLFDWVDNLGRGTRPVFLSEYGVGSQFDYWRLARLMEQAGESPANAHPAALAKRNDALLKRYIAENGLEQLYPAPRDLILDSYREQAKYREQAFSMIRMNPNIIGYSMTAVQDHGFAGEGFMGIDGEFKPGHLDVMQDGWAPLRMCLLTNPTHIYADEPMRLRAYLADEGAIAPGEYPVSLRIYNDSQIVWEKKISVVIAPGERPAVHRVFDETVTVDGLSEGEWSFSAVLEKGAPAGGGRISFYVSQRETLPGINAPVSVAGELSEDARTLLTGCGARLTPYKKGATGVIAVGRLYDENTWDDIYESVAAGARAVFLDPCSLTKEGVPFEYLDESRTASRLRREDGSGATLISNWEWLYHRIAIGKPSSLTKGLKARRMLDQNYYNDVLSQLYFRLEKPCAESAVLAFAMNVVASGGVDAIEGVMLGRENYGRGEYFFSALDILGNIGHPAADKLLCGLVSRAAQE